MGTEHCNLCFAGSCGIPGTGPDCCVWSCPYPQGTCPTSPCGRQPSPVPSSHPELGPVQACVRAYLRAFCSRCRQSTASGQCLRDCRKRCTWGRRMLLGGKRPVHSQNSSQPRSSLYLQEEAWCPARAPQGAEHPQWPHTPQLLTTVARGSTCPDPQPCLRTNMGPPPRPSLPVGQPMQGRTAA